MNQATLREKIRPWLEGKLEASLSSLRSEPIPVLASGSTGPAIRGVKIRQKAVFVARPEWVDPLQEILADLGMDLAFSIFGAYEISRLTLPDGMGVWGPSWWFFADQTTWRPAHGHDVVKLKKDELAVIDRDTFWHCFISEAMAGFAIYERDKVVALACVRDEGDPVWEIGMDVLQDAQGGGLGRAVTSAAAKWILDHDKLVLATTSTFNVPSARTLRSLGLQYIFSNMGGRPGGFRVPPQPLGSPYPGAELYDFYPRWAMNHEIKPRPGSS